MLSIQIDIVLLRRLLQNPDVIKTSGFSHPQPDSAETFNLIQPVPDYRTLSSSLSRRTLTAASLEPLRLEPLRLATGI
ncbi:MAG: hypothetical protein HLUCCO16_02165 [Phormidium sp. OSCR]|nr:MAG: hypothetical protein HLUCCO16_02165 [Phormidium sp. OSCR]